MHIGCLQIRADSHAFYHWDCRPTLTWYMFQRFVTLTIIIINLTTIHWESVSFFYTLRPLVATAIIAFILNYYCHVKVLLQIFLSVIKTFSKCAHTKQIEVILSQPMKWIFYKITINYNKFFTTNEMNLKKIGHCGDRLQTIHSNLSN